MLVVDRRKEPREIAREAMLTARMNVLYHRTRADKYLSWNLRLQCVSAVAASATLVQLLRATPHGDLLTMGLSGVAALGSALGPIIRFSDRARVASGLLGEYVQHHHDFLRLYERLSEITTEELERALDAYHQTELREAKEDPGCDEKLLAACQDKVDKEQGHLPPAKAAA